MCIFRKKLNLPAAVFRVKFRPNEIPRLLDHLFANPYITASRVEEILGVSAPTARQAIGHLVAENVLVETTGRSWGRLYVAQPILQALE